MRPYNLPEHSVQLTLQYLLPPVPPLPPHLLSNALRARHNLLHASDAASYFCWPVSCSEPDRLISLLESLSASDLSPNRISQPAYAVPDEETLLSGVDLGGLVRVVWKWEADRHEWGYHDALLLPAPLGTPIFSFRNVEDALHTLPSASPLLALDQPSAPHGTHTDPNTNTSSVYQLRASSSSSDAPNDYWDRYGSRSPSPGPMRGGHTSEDANAAEDAYWASYNRVHGTGDSTVPSPVRPSPALPTQFGERPSSAQDVDMRDFAPRPARQPETAPERRSEALLSPQPSSPPSSRLFAPTATSKGRTSSPATRFDSPSFSQPSFQPSSNTEAERGRDLPARNSAGTDEALEEAMKGIWKMWNVGKRSGDGEADKETFVAAARRAAGGS